MRAVTLSSGPPGHNRTSLAEKAYAALKGELHNFSWVPGDRLSEGELGQRLGVSRTPVREALFRLRTEGLVDVESKLGWYVKPIDFERLDQLYDPRIVLELASVDRLVVRRDDTPELATLKSIWLVPVAERQSDPQRMGELDEAFHASLVKASGNLELSRVHQDVTERIRVVRRLDFTRPDRIDATYSEHGKILRAIIQRKGDQAKLMLRSHIEQSKAEVRKITLHTLHEAKLRSSISILASR